jgi:hypothetical protein
MFSQVIYDATTRSFGETQPIGDIACFFDNLSEQDQILVLHGLYNDETVKTPKVVKKNLLALIDQIAKMALKNLVVVTTSDKKLEVPMDEEVAKRSKVTYPMGTYPGGMDKRAEGTLSLTKSGNILWRSMVFPFSNFGHTPIDRKVSDLFTFEQLKSAISMVTTKAVNWKAVQKIMNFKITTVEFIIQALMKTIASALMPAVLDSESAVKTFKFNVGKLAKVEIGGVKINRMVIIRTKEELEKGLSHVFGVKRSPEELDLSMADDKTTFELNDLVAIVNDYIREFFDNDLSDRQVKDLANALHIHPSFFQTIGNGTPAELGELDFETGDVGVNTFSQAAGLRLRQETDPEFDDLMKELRIRKVQIAESAAHKRFDSDNKPFYYIDNTFGDDFGVQMAPPQEGILFEGKKHTFYNAMGHGYTLAQTCGDMTPGELILKGISRVAAG